MDSQQRPPAFFQPPPPVAAGRPEGGGGSTPSPPHSPFQSTLPLPPPPPPGGLRSLPPPPPPGGLRSLPPPPPPGGLRSLAPPPPPGGLRSLPPPPPPGGIRALGVHTNPLYSSQAAVATTPEGGRLPPAGGSKRLDVENAGEGWLNLRAASAVCLQRSKPSSAYRPPIGFASFACAALPAACRLCRPRPQPGHRGQRLGVA